MLTEATIKELSQFKLSPNFNAMELLKSSRYPELVVVPYSVVFNELILFAKNGLEEFREACCNNTPVGIDSCYRNPVLNKKVGGELDSVHQVFYPLNIYQGVAADVVPRKVSVFEAFSKTPLLKKGTLRGFILYPKRGFIHIDSAVKRKSREWYVSMEKGKYTPIPESEVPNIREWLLDKFKFEVKET